MSVGRSVVQMLLSVLIWLTHSVLKHCHCQIVSSIVASLIAVLFYCCSVVLCVLYGDIQCSNVRCFIHRESTRVTPYIVLSLVSPSLLCRIFTINQYLVLIQPRVWWDRDGCLTETWSVVFRVTHSSNVCTSYWTWLVAVLSVLMYCNVMCDRDRPSVVNHRRSRDNVHSVQPRPAPAAAR